VTDEFGVSLPNEEFTLQALPKRRVAVAMRSENKLRLVIVELLRSTNFEFLFFCSSMFFRVYRACAGFSTVKPVPCYDTHECYNGKPRADYLTNSDSEAEPRGKWSESREEQVGVAQRRSKIFFAQVARLQ
jgi:hypothetical protein